MYQAYHHLFTRFSAYTLASRVGLPLLPWTFAVALVRILFSGSCISLNLLKSTLGLWMTLIFLTLTFLTGQMGEISLVIFFSMTSEVKRLRIWVALDLAISLATMSLILFLMIFCWEERAQLVLRFWLGDSRVKAMTKTRSTYPSWDLTSWIASMRVFLFLMRELSSSRVISTPQKEVMACLPSVWSTMSLIFLQWKESWLGARSACMELTTLPLMLSQTFSEWKGSYSILASCWRR